MAKGMIYTGESFSYIDDYSGRTVTRLTNYLGHSHHLYFTDPCWFNQGQSIIFASDRENRTNLFRYDLDTFTITQLTDLESSSFTSRREYLKGTFSKANNCFYYWWGKRKSLYELNPDTLAERLIYRIPEEMPMISIGHASVTADGRYVCDILREANVSEVPHIGYAYSDFFELFESRPQSQVVRIDVQTGEIEVIVEEKRFLTHCNTSPKLPNILTFCHEGPWDRVQQRIWGLNIETGEVWKIREQSGQAIAVGHEYWMADGEHIGYHGRLLDGSEQHVFGTIRWDNADHCEVSFPFHSTHFHSLNDTMIVGDGTPASVIHNSIDVQPYIQLFRLNGSSYEGPRVLAFHRSTFNDQHAHCHPRFTPDGKYVLYSSDLTGYANMYLAEVGDFEDLPLMSEVLAVVGQE